MTAKEFLKRKLEAEVLMYERKLSDLNQEIFNSILERWSDDSLNLENHRFNLQNIMIPEAKSKKILDMAAGCGSFVIQGLRNGYDTYGVEPEQWKQDLIDLKFKENDYPEAWRSRIVQGIGEDLPFEDETFDVFDSWQTIEHVQNEEKCIMELYRVLKPGGSGILQGPSYWCFNEGHYRMFWFPMLRPDSAFARLYLKLRRRPSAGLATFHPVNPAKIRKYARNVGFEIVNIKRKQIYDAARRRMPVLKKKLFYPSLPLIYALWSFWRVIKKAGLGQRTIAYLLIKK
ncbi:MAG: hypothetical protein C0592_13360 [Marinilabiliales bacterium]|nr:MAG: hypothetical protein C0592_13360 [Marinilabiliales bacterium]